MGHLYNDDTGSHEKGPAGSRNEWLRNPPLVCLSVGLSIRLTGLDFFVYGSSASTGKPTMWHTSGCE